MYCKYIIHTSKLKKGDVAILYRGGHSFKVIEENTVFYEIKNGPYIGSKFDKENIIVLINPSHEKIRKGMDVVFDKAVKRSKGKDGKDKSL